MRRPLGLLLRPRGPAGEVLPQSAHPAQQPEALDAAQTTGERVDVPARKGVEVGVWRRRGGAGVCVPLQVPPLVPLS